MSIDLVRDLDALVPEPAGDLGDRDALGKGDGRVAVAERVRDELPRQSCLYGGAGEVFLVGTTDYVLVPAAGCASEK